MRLRKTKTHETHQDNNQCSCGYAQVSTAPFPQESIDGDLDDGNHHHADCRPGDLCPLLADPDAHSFEFVPMSWFSRKPPDERQTRSQEQMARGGLPVNAEERLTELRQSKTLFTSGLSVNEFVLAADDGIRPLGQVMGSTIFHVGFQYQPLYTGGELIVWTHAQTQARRLALSRLQQEAKLLGAHGVLGVRLELQTQDWGRNLIEFTASGTAMAIDGEEVPVQPFLCALSGQEFWMLRRGGYWPVGVALGICGYYQVATVSTQYAQQSWRSMELPDYTQAVYMARHAAMSRLQSDAAHVSAEGVVGVTVGTDVRTNEVEINDQSRRDLIVFFTAIGTAINPRHERWPMIDYALPLNG
jgi:uncharacterized protein YbjQ (UPF0145 family)